MKCKHREKVDRKDMDFIDLQIHFKCNVLSDETITIACKDNTNEKMPEETCRIKQLHEIALNKKESSRTHNDTAISLWLLGLVFLSWLVYITSIITGE